MNTEKLNKLVKTGKIKEAHTSKRSGYVSRRGPPEVHPYKGKFGEGFVKYTPSFTSTQYYYVTYYIRTSYRVYRAGVSMTIWR